MSDRIAGALLLSMYGDAAGLPHEASGLKGNPGDPSRDPLPVVDGFREDKPNPWNIWASPDITAGMRGVVSDDTATKVALVEPWLASTDPAAFPESDRGFRAWLPRRPVEAVAWREAMAAEQARQWEGMYAGAEGQAGCGDDGSPCFYRAGMPVIFGPFLFQSLALGCTGLPAPEVYRRFAGFCALDQAEGRIVSGLLAALTAAALDGPHDTERFDAWLGRTPVHLDRAISTGKTADAEAKRAYADRLVWLLGDGRPSHDTPPADFLRWMTEELYHHDQRGATHDLKPFDALLQFSQVMLCGLYGQGDPARTMAVATNLPGDADTVPMVLGLILGAWHGRDTLMSGPLADGLRKVEATTAELFGRTIDERVAIYTRFTG